MALSLSDLISPATKASIYQTALSVATTLGLPVTSWQPGDPTRSLYHVLSEKLSTFELVAAEFVRGGFLSLARGFWLTTVAKEVYNVDEVEETYATTDVVLTNNGGGYYTVDPGDVIVKNTTTGKTYTSTTGGTLASGPGTTLTITVVADESGSESNAAAGEIDALVTTTILEVTCTNPTAAQASDKEEPDALRARCLAKLASLSPNGSKDAYTYVALTPELTGTTGITKARALAPPGDGTITIVLAGPSGAVSSGDVNAAEAAIIQYANPVVATPLVQSASTYALSVTYQLWIYSTVNKTAAQIQTEANAALDAAIARVPIGGDDGNLVAQSMLQSAILAAFPGYAFRVSVTVPSGDLTLTDTQVAVAGTHTGTINLVSP